MPSIEVMTNPCQTLRLITIKMGKSNSYHYFTRYVILQERNGNKVNVIKLRTDN